MKTFSNLQDNKISKLIKSGAIGIIPTDTVYGIVAGVSCVDSVEKIYKIKKRDRSKAVIVLIDSAEKIKEIFKTSCPEKIKKIWPNKVSVILPCKKFPHIHRGKETIAFRVPNDKKLRHLISLSGPIVAPSANFQGDPTVKSIGEAIKIFGNKVDFYVDGGVVKKASPSTVVKYQDGQLTVLREGAVKSDKIL